MMRLNSRFSRLVALLGLVSTATAIGPLAGAKDQATNAAENFPPELVAWEPHPKNPVFTAQSAGTWAARIRERGWILREGNSYHLWFTGYDGTRLGLKKLGYATSPDGMHWTPHAKNPLTGDHWVEDMMVVKFGEKYFMFAEGAGDNHAVMLTSNDRVHWTWDGPLDIRRADGKQPAARPCGTPTVWRENGAWYLFYEHLDAGVWLAKASELKSRVWINVQDTPVLVPGPGSYDKDLIALDQIIERRGVYYAFYHGSGGNPRTWNTNIARSSDLVHWEKYSGNPLVGDNKSSGIVVPVGRGLRLYTMHDQVDVYERRGR